MIISAHIWCALSHNARQPLEKNSAGGDDDGKKKKRRKKTPGGAKEGRGPAGSRSGGGLRIIDDEADMPTLDKKRVNKAWEEEETEGAVLDESCTVLV